LLRSAKEDAMPWRYDLRGRINRRRCPSFGKTTPRNLRGRRCHLNVRWKGEDELFIAVGRRKMRVRGG
jgi:hypothetical protein